MLEKRTLPVTVIIPHWNRYDDLKRCVDSIFVLDMLPESIIIIDDNSEPNLLRSIKENISYPNVRILTLTRRIGPSEIKNIGIWLCETPYIWFLDSDTEIVNPNSLEFAYQLIRSSHDIAAIGGELVYDLNGEIFLRETTLLKNYWTLCRHHLVQKDSLFCVQMIPTNNFLAKTNLLKDVGGFCPILNIGEDKLLSLLLREKGYKLFFSSMFGVIHHYSFTGRPKLREHQEKYLADHAFIFGAVSGYPKLIFFSYFNLITIVHLLSNSLSKRIFLTKFKRTNCLFKSVFDDELLKYKRMNILKKIAHKFWEIYKSNDYIMLVRGIKYQMSNQNWDKFINERLVDLKKILFYEK